MPNPIVAEQPVIVGTETLVGAPAIADLAQRLEPFKAKDAAGKPLDPTGLDAEKSRQKRLLNDRWRNLAPEQRSTLGVEHALALGEYLLKPLGDPILAAEVLDRHGEGLSKRLEDEAKGSATAPDDEGRALDLRLAHAVAKARNGCLAFRRAARLLALMAKQRGHTDGETMGLLARADKEQAWKTPSLTARRERLQRAYRNYEAGHAHSTKLVGVDPTKAASDPAARRALDDAIYAGINAAAMAFLLESRSEARSLAERVLSMARQRLEHDDQRRPRGFWSAVTAGDAQLILGDHEGAAETYRRAQEERGEDVSFDMIATVRQQARRILNHQRADDSWLDQTLRVPSAVMFTGHRPDAPGSTAARFPDTPERMEGVKTQIVEFLRERDAGFGFSSAAAGADLLFIEAMLERGGRPKVVLPIPVEDFIRESVDNGQTPHWRERFARTVFGPDGKTVRPEIDIVVLCREQVGDSPAVFQYANNALHGLAELRRGVLGTTLHALCVWDRKPPRGPGGTADAVWGWRSAGREVHVIDPARPLRPVEGLAPPTLPGDSGPPPPGSQGEVAVRAMLFADAVGFSKLREGEIRPFVTAFLAQVGKLRWQSEWQPEVANTWGDGLFFGFSDVRSAGLFGLELRRLVRDGPWDKIGMLTKPDLRLALHAGPVFKLDDPVTGQPNFFGGHVSRTARIEPVTPPGLLYATEPFAALAAVQAPREFHCEYVGRVPLAKSYGDEGLYRVTRGDD
jgi:hypothetical protein